METSHAVNVKALIFANGDINDGLMARQAIEDAQAAASMLVVAADGGARVAQHYGLHVDMIIGDMDSLSDDEVQFFAARGAELQHYPQEKNETDLELALQRTAQQGIRWMRILGGVGDRIDQTIANLYLLTLPILRECDVRLVSGRQESWLLHPGEHGIRGSAGDTVSLIPVGGLARGVRTTQLYYPLKNETLAFGPARGISNVMDADEARVSLQDGLLLVVHTIGRA